jgi:peptidyl-prolyl cis-trans isomerase B (cyclophilin B)
MKHLVCNVMAAIPVVFFSGWANAETQHTLVELETSSGTIVLELFDDKAPKTVENFINYVDSGYYSSTTFHRVIKGFMVQGGGLDENMAPKPTKPPIPNEADNGLNNLRGTVAMARTMEPHSATSQFFINTVDNSFLDFKAKSPQGWGYCVFGKVVKGMDIVDSIEKQPTTQRSGHKDVPVTPIKIIRAQKVTEVTSSEQ